MNGLHEAIKFINPINPFCCHNFHFAVGAGNPDLFRARAAGGFPIHGAAHDVPHLGEPPVGAGAPVPRARPDSTGFAAVDAEFELFVVHI